MNMVDSHCHLDLLDLDRLESDIDGVIETARRHDVTTLLCVSISLEQFPRVLRMAQSYDNVYGSVGVHPNERDGREPTVEELVEIAQREERVVAIGETGLDYYRSDGDLDWQRERFRRHIAAARRVDLPLIVHMRDAEADTLRLLEEAGEGQVRGVMHCFAADLETAEAALALGFYISFSGIVTFKNAGSLKEVARQVPADRLLIETDAPYLAPVPYRGKTNQPAYVRYVAYHLAELRGVHADEIAETTTGNFERLFGVPAGRHA